MNPSITDWLMVIITFVYVVATIFICIFNAKSANAARAQLADAQRQQNINIGLQLYAMRKAVLDRLKKLEFDEVYSDILLLFTEELAEEFGNILAATERMDELMETADAFEDGLSSHLEEQAIKSISQQRLRAKNESDFEGLRSSIKTICVARKIDLSVVEDIDDYLAVVKEINELNEFVTPAIPALIDELREFIIASTK